MSFVQFNFDMFLINMEQDMLIRMGSRNLLDMGLICWVSSQYLQKLLLA